MRKELTISVAAYNVEKFIRQTLDSCCCDEIVDYIEVLVVDDGARDGTDQIVQQYEDKYPGTVKLVHKENGGYGTTVNTSVKLAQGEFFKLLDGDDWFDRDGLVKLVNILKTTDADIVFNQMYKEYPDKEMLEKDTWAKYIGEKIRLADVESGVYAGMWEMSVRTEILRTNWIDLPGKTLYTDHLFIIQALPYAKDVLFLNFPVYCYRLGYSEQSVSTESRRKHIDEIVKVSNMVSKYYKNYCKETDNYIFARERARFTYMEAHRALMLKKYGFSTKKAIEKFDRELKCIDEDVYNECEKQSGKRSLKFIRKTNYYGYFLVYIKDQIYKKLKK